MPTVKRPFTNQKTFYNRIVDGWNLLDSSLQIINLIMVFVKSQDVKLKRVKDYDLIKRFVLFTYEVSSFLYTILIYFA